MLVYTVFTQTRPRSERQSLAEPEKYVGTEYLVHAKVRKYIVMHKVGRSFSRSFGRSISSIIIFISLYFRSENYDYRICASDSRPASRAVYRQPEERCFIVYYHYDYYYVLYGPWMDRPSARYRISLCWACDVQHILYRTRKLAKPRRKIPLMTLIENVSKGLSGSHCTAPVVCWVCEASKSSSCTSSWEVASALRVKWVTKYIRLASWLAAWHFVLRPASSMTQPSTLERQFTPFRPIQHQVQKTTMQTCFSSLIRVPITWRSSHESHAIEAKNKKKMKFCEPIKFWDDT